MLLVVGAVLATAIGVWFATLRTVGKVPPQAGDHAAAAEAADLVDRGRRLLDRQSLAEAHDAFERALSRDSGSADAHRGLAAVAYDQGALMRAVAHLERAAALDPADGRPHRMIGHICRDLDHRERAVAAYREALSRGLSPAATTEVRIELAEQLLKLGDAVGALGELPEVDDHSAAFPPLLAVRCEATWIADGADAAQEVLAAAIRRHPDDASLLALLGRVQVDLGHWEEAIEPLTRAAAIDPTDLATLQALVTAHERLGKQAEAARLRERREAVQAALERLSRLTREADADPWNATIRDELAATCEQLGKADLAAMWRHAAAQARARITDSRRPPP